MMFTTLSILKIRLFNVENVKTDTIFEMLSMKMCGLLFDMYTPV